MAAHSHHLPVEPAGDGSRRVNALILAPPGPLRAGLRALLSALPALAGAAEAGDWAAAETRLKAQPPDLLLLDLALPAPPGADPALDWLRARAPRARCLALADDVAQLAALPPRAGLAAVLKGAPASELVTAIERLLAAQPPPGY